MKWRGKRRASQRVLSEFAGLHPSVVSRLEAGGDAKLSTWLKELKFAVEDAEGWDDCEDYLFHTTDERHWRRLDNLRR